ncbi:MAG TPA: HAD family hydrolase [Bacteriovoracaceae bacterium]|nr:HAD family hydrolase [Bacteriovoracaceae bacterium]
MGKKAVFLDRDGVLNQTIFRMGKARAPYSLEELKLFDGVIDAIKELKAAGYFLVIVTNQPDVARGWVGKLIVESVNKTIMEELKIDSLQVCYHTEKDNCLCRKPRPGMLLAARDEWGIDMTQSFMVGDRFSDIEAGSSAGCRTILVGEGDNVPALVTPDFFASSLLTASRWILSRP